MTRRGAREGTIRHREDGRWEARYRLADGRRRSIFAKTSSEVRDRLRAALTAADAGLPVIDQRPTVGAWLDEWLAASVTGRLRPRTAESYASTVRLYLKPSVGRIALAKLTPEHVNRLRRELEARGGERGPLSSTTVRYAIVVLRIALGRALKSGRVARNVATLVDTPTLRHPDLRPLTADQARAFLAAVEREELGPLYLTAIATGMRQGELLALRWSDVDLEAGTIAVRHTLRRVERVLADPKTGSAKRVLRIGAGVTSALRENRLRQLERRLAAGARWREQDYVFSGPNGDAWHARNILTAFQRALARAGLPRQRFHDLRHACATLLLEQGEELGVVSKLLGHSTVATTLDVYAHLTPAMGDRAAARMDAVLRTGSSS
jgi:integrase